MKIGGVIALCGMLLFASDAEARCAKSPRYLTKEYLQDWEIIAFGIVTDIHGDPSARHNSYAVLASWSKSWLSHGVARAHAPSCPAPGVTRAAA